MAGYLTCIMHLENVDVAGGDRSGGGEAETETYQESGGGVKVLVSGLTGLVNAVMRRDGEIPEERPERQAITVGELRDGIQGDYERCRCLNLSMTMCCQHAACAD